jgi:hypothetical protein
VKCPRCGDRRTVITRQARRVRACESDGLCSTCRRGSKPDSRLDLNLRYWLGAYGARPPAGTCPREFIASGGAPMDLVQLAASIFPNEQPKA